MEFEVLEKYEYLIEIEQGASLTTQISDIYDKLFTAVSLSRKWMETHNEAGWHLAQSEIEFTKSLTAVTLDDPKNSGRNKRILKEAVTTVLELMLGLHRLKLRNWSVGGPSLYTGSVTSFVRCDWVIG